MNYSYYVSSTGQLCYGTPYQQRERSFIVVKKKRKNSFLFSVLLMMMVVACLNDVTAQNIVTIAGNNSYGYSGDAGPATAAQLSSPNAAAVYNGAVYIADLDFNVVRKVDTFGIITTIAGIYSFGYSGDAGPATDAELNAPAGVAFDRKGNLYIADLYNFRIRKVDTFGNITTYAGTGTPGYTGDLGAATAATLNSPVAVTCDTIGNLYIADNSNYVIRKVDTNGIITTYAGNNTSGFSGDGGPATTAELASPVAVYADPAGNLYIADAGNQTVRKVNSTTGMISTIAGVPSTPGYTGDSGPATAAELNGPFGIAIIKQNIYISDKNNNVVRKITTDGIISTVVGNSTGGYLGDGGLATAAELNQPRGLASVDTGRKLFIADYNNFVVRAYSVPLLTVDTISGSGTVCVYNTITLSDSSTGGNWSASNNNAIINSSGVVVGLTPGIDTISYTIISSGDTAIAQKVITINPMPDASVITGVDTICIGGMTTLSDTASGGVWGASNGNAGLTGNIVTGVTAGMDTISYMVTNACGTAMASAVITVSPLPDSGVISGTTAVCVGSSITLTESVTGGTWTASNGNASVFAGLVTGTSDGLDTIFYTVTSACGSATANTIITVNPLPDAGMITGTDSVCVGSSITLSDTASGGLWNASNSNGSLFGNVLTGSLAGMDTISYLVVTGCGSATATTVVTVDPLPDAGTISGITTVCAGASTTLTESVVGGTWSVSNDNATIFDGLVTGITAGIDTVTYTYTNSCGTATTTAVVTVNPLPDAGVITGTDTVCTGASITLADTASGGLWTASNGNATLTGSIVTGVIAGLDTVNYFVTTGCGTATALTVVTINATPDPGTISGAASVCVGSSITLSESVPFGTWSSSNGNGTVFAGLVTGITAGIDTITYTVTTACGSDSTYSVITINPLPNAGVITGTDTICVGSATTLIDTASGGTWSASNGTATLAGNVAIGVNAGLDTISYLSTTACGTATAYSVITVNPLPFAGAIDGTDSVCVGSSILLSDTASGGTWSALIGNASVAAGVVSGISAGTDVISYTVINSCGTASSSVTVTIDPLPDAGAISGVTEICNFSSTILSNLATGGVWSESNGNATLADSFVTGVAPGMDTITYTVTTFCGTAMTSTVVTIDALPDAGVISGADTVCLDGTIILTDTASGGTWSASNGNAVVTGGYVTGIVPNTIDTITYTISTTCGVSFAFASIYVNALPDAGTITGADSICVDAVIAFSDTAIGGIWSATNGNASVDAYGNVTGATSGIDTISYAVANTCGISVATLPVVVDPLPDAGAITGKDTVCVGGTSVLTNALPGGVWTASNGFVNIDSTGVITGVSLGDDTITYTAMTTCGSAVTSVVVSVYSIEPPVVTQKGDTLSTSSYATYQWKVGAVDIDGANSQSYVYSTVGDFTVIVTNGYGCVATSAGTDILTLRVAQITPSDISIYPNPAQSILHIQSPSMVNAKLFDMGGKLVLQAERASEINLSTVPSGSYILELYDERGAKVKTQTIVKGE
jgi:Secretion system C-terminal sorting domain